MKNPKKYFEVFSSGASRIAGFGEGTPQQDLPQGQNRRYADFGTVVESCSTKLPTSSAVAFVVFPLSLPTPHEKAFLPTQRGIWGKRLRKSFVFSFAALHGQGGSFSKHVFLFHHYYGRQARFGKNGRKKSRRISKNLCGSWLVVIQFLFS